MKLVTSEQMQQIDRETIDSHGIPGPELMENAGRGIAERIAAHVMHDVDSASVAVFCGKGNNGGDGYVVARYLSHMGADVVIYYLGPPDKLSDDALLNYKRTQELGLRMIEITAVDDLPEVLDAEYIIEGIFGTGFSGAPRGLSGEIIEYINRRHGCTVISIDMPSGLNADTGTHEGAVVRAEHTFTLALPKYGLYVSPGRELAGEVQTVPIGVPPEVITKFELPVELITVPMVADRLPDRPTDGHKGTFGKVLIVAGSFGMTGAAALAARSAYRSGCGLVKVACPTTVLPIIAGTVIEATSHPLPDVARKGALALRALGEIRSLAAEHEALAIGPGIGRHRETFELMRRLVPNLDKPAVVDADALNAFEGHVDLIAAREHKAPLVLTPHPGEFKRLTGESVPNHIHERISLARATAARLNCVLVLKGSPTLIADPGGACYLNPTGNDGMACGGTGDVLTGAIGSLLAQGMSAIDAAVCAVYVHGMAGDFAAADRGRRSMTAPDMLDYLSEAFMLVE